MHVVTEDPREDSALDARFITSLHTGVARRPYLHTLTRCLIAVVALSVFSCGDNTEGPVDAVPRPPCSDSRDNDGDGLIDFPEDPGCANLESNAEDAPRKPQCSDNRDNDGDGLMDFPNDPGCLAPEIDEEKDDCPDGPLCPMCANSVDDDASGAMDFPLDVGCDSAADSLEYGGNPNACGPGFTLKTLPPSGIDSGMLTTMSVANFGSCGPASDTPGVGYVLVLSRPRVVFASTAGSAIDTVLSIRRPPCEDNTEVSCNDNNTATDLSSRITRQLEPGVYFIIVRAKVATGTGAYAIRVQLLNLENDECNTNAECAPGLVCRVPKGGVKKICTQPVCRDGVDEDDDGRIDWPNDPGCVTEIDNDEADDCPAGPTCPKCSDVIDNDGDGVTDYPLDESCTAASDGSEGCITREKPIPVITGITTTGTTVGSYNDYDPTCNAATGVSPDVLYRLDLPALSRLTLNVTGFDTVTTLLDSTCGGTPIACSDPPLMTVNNLAAGTYYATVEGFSGTTTGAYTITTGGTIAPNGSCEHPMYQNGTFTCEAGFICDGPAGARTCRTQCSDGLDNNADGRIDFPNDPGCESQRDNSESSVCPGAACPECTDGMDNDNDGQTDFPNDPQCRAASSTSELCTSSESVTLITTGVTVGNTTNATDDYDPTCNSPTGAAPDVLYRLDVPTMASLTLNVTGTLNTVTTVLDSTCGGTPIRCSDPQSTTFTDFPGGTYYVGIEAFTGTTVGAFTLNTSGTVAPGASCEGVLFQSGAFTCTTGHACDGMAGSRTCVVAQCNDGLDNNGDGTIDFPNDPGCTSRSDNSEDNVCPGAMCPECGDGMDNDGDTQTDYPNDTTCTSASGGSEACAGEIDPILPITMPTTSDTLVGASDGHNPTCGLDGGPDKMYTLRVPALATLKLDTEGSMVSDTLLSLMTGACTEPGIECDDDDGTGNLSLIQRTNVAAGSYIIAVDAYSTSVVPAPFKLNVSGTVAPDASCEGPLFENGVLTCTTGYACNGVMGSRTCSRQCSDGIDNNGDGNTDFPNDPGCTSAADPTEDTLCPGAMCPACGDGMDNDSDGQTDYPADVACPSASGVSENFCSVDPDYRGHITTPVTMGTLAAPAGDHRDQTCQAPANTGNDVVYSLTSSVAATWEITTEGSTIFDTLLSVHDPTCSVTQYACDDDSGTGRLSRITLALPAGAYSIQVDSFSQTGNNGPFQLNVVGTVAPDVSCEDVLFASGVLTCPTGYACNGVVGSRTCTQECSDGIDNNGDGKTDFPDDPGCTSATDPIEDTLCPGAMCPACSDGMDNDSDGQTDYPADVSCSSASDATEDI